MFITLNLPHPIVSIGIARTNPIDYPAKDDPLWFHKQNLQYTASGYGKKIPTRFKVKFDNKWYRVYVMQYSNCGSAYIVARGIKIFANDTVIH